MWWQEVNIETERMAIKRRCFMFAWFCGVKITVQLSTFRQVWRVVTPLEGYNSHRGFSTAVGVGFQPLTGFSYLRRHDRKNPHSRFWLPIHPTDRACRQGSKCVLRDHPLPQRLWHLTPDLKGIILSGSPFSVNDEKAPSVKVMELVKQRPILGICYGAQLTAKLFGGRVGKSQKRGNMAALPCR